MKRCSWVTRAVFMGAAYFGVAACSEDAAAPRPVDATGGAGGAGVGGAGGGEPTSCGTALDTLDKTTLVALAFDDGVPFSNLRDESYSVSTNNNTYVLNDWPVHEAVRFELEHPARIHGFEVMWAAIPDDWDGATELAAGLYPDFGHNGFDFWADDPLWQGTRCVRDVDDAGAFTTYAFEEPIELAQAGLVYVAHLAQPGSPTWWFDEPEALGDNPCEPFDGCQSAINLPTAEFFTFHNAATERARAAR